MTDSPRPPSTDLLVRAQILHKRWEASEGLHALNARERPGERLVVRPVSECKSSTERRVICQGQMDPIGFRQIAHEDCTCCHTLEAVKKCKLMHCAKQPIGICCSKGFTFSLIVELSCSRKPLSPVEGSSTRAAQSRRGEAKRASPRTPSFHWRVGRAAALRGGSGCRGLPEFPLSAEAILCKVAASFPCGLSGSRRGLVER